MALVSLMTKVSATVPIKSISSLSQPSSFAAINTVPVRNYIKNFFNEKTAIKPVLGWMHQNREKGAGNKTKKLRLNLMRYSEIKRQRTSSYEARMKTEGGRKIIMRRILMDRDHLSG